MSKEMELIREWNQAFNANPPQSLSEANEAYMADNFVSLDKDGNPQMTKLG